MRRTPAVLTALVLAVIPATAGHAAPAKHVRAYDKNLLKYVNQERAKNGLRPMKESARLYGIAHKWAVHMAQTRNLEHNPNAVIGSKLILQKCPHSTTESENVGEQSTTSAKQMFALYMGDPYHASNILRSNTADVGIATVKASDGSEWNVMDFANHCA